MCRSGICHTVSLATSSHSFEMSIVSCCNFAALAAFFAPANDDEPRPHQLIAGLGLALDAVQSVRGADHQDGLGLLSAQAPREGGVERHRTAWACAEAS
eukprot:COSAG02_NODE_1410_length_12758_cov_67.963504_1_plen_99_part_00